MRRPSDADPAEVVEPDRNGAIASAESHEEVHPQPGDGGQVGEADSAACQFGEARLRLRQRAGQELAFRPVQLQREGELMPALPAIRRQQRRPGGEIGQRRRVRGRGLGAPARDQVQLGDPLPLLARGDQGRAAVELADDLEDVLLDRLGRRARG